MTETRITYPDHNSPAFHIRAHKAPLFVRGFFILIFLISTILPFIGIVLAAQSETGIRFGNFVLLIVFELIAFYLLRVLLWNTYGIESYKIENDHLEYEADYKWFKDGKKTLNLDSIQISIKDLEDGTNGIIHLTDGTNEINSVIKVELSELNKLKARMEKEVSKTIKKEH